VDQQRWRGRTTTKAANFSRTFIVEDFAPTLKAGHGWHKDLDPKFGEGSLSFSASIRPRQRFEMARKTED
jgi:hypothetical protein